MSTPESGTATRLTSDQRRAIAKQLNERLSDIIDTAAEVRNRRREEVTETIIEELGARKSQKAIKSHKLIAETLEQEMNSLGLKLNYRDEVEIEDGRATRMLNERLASEEKRIEDLQLLRGEVASQIWLATTSEEAERLLDRVNAAAKAE